LTIGISRNQLQIFKKYCQYQYNIAILTTLHLSEQVCRSSLLSGQNVHWPRRMLPSGEWVTMPTVQTDTHTDRRQTVTLHFPLNAASVECGFSVSALPGTAEAFSQVKW